MILVETSQTWMVKSKSVSDLDFADTGLGQTKRLTHQSVDCKCTPGSRMSGGIFWVWSIPAQIKRIGHIPSNVINLSIKSTQSIWQDYSSENLWIARDHKCDEKPHRLPRGPGEVNQNCPHHHHQHPHHRHIINPRFECTVDMRCLVSYIQWFHTTPDNGGSEYWRTKIQNFQEHRSLQDNRS